MRKKFTSAERGKWIQSMLTQRKIYKLLIILRYLERCFGTTAKVCQYSLVSSFFVFIGVGHFIYTVKVAFWKTLETLDIKAVSSLNGWLFCWWLIDCEKQAWLINDWFIRQRKFIEIWSTREVWRARRMRKRATLASWVSYLNECTADVWTNCFITFSGRWKIFFLDGFVCWRHECAQWECEARSRNWIWSDKFTSYVIINITVDSIIANTLRGRSSVHKRECEMAWCARKKYWIVSKYMK